MENNEEIEAEIRQYPSNFDLFEEVEQLPKEYLEIVTKKLIKECETTPYGTMMETLRAWNLISFLHFVLGDEKLALEYNAKVLELCKENLIGLCNKAWFLFKTQEFYKVKSMLSNLKEKFLYGTNALVAKAEKAFCYSRFGMKLYEKSCEMFKKVLEECADIKASNVDASAPSMSSEAYSKLKTIPADNICIWTFGYALIFKRMLNIGNLHDQASLDLSKQRYVTVCELYSRIISMNSESASINRYKARSYVEIGLLAYNVLKDKERFSKGIADILPGHRDLWMPTGTYFTAALELCPDDCFVLERSGKYFRYTCTCISDIAKSIKYLEKAITIRESAFSHHHLALSLKRQIEFKEKRHASRNLFSKFKKADCTTQTQTLSRKEKSTEVLNTCMQSPSTSAIPENTKKLEPPNDSQIKETFSQTIDSAQNSLGFHSKWLDSEKDQITTKYVTTAKHSGKTLSAGSNTDHLSDSLQQMSFDSAYETMPHSTNALNQKYMTHSNAFHQAMEAEDNLKDIKLEGKIQSDKSYRNVLQNRNQNQKRRGSRDNFGKYRRGSQIERSISQPTSSNHNHSGVKGRRNHKQEFKRGLSATEHYKGSPNTNYGSAVARMIKSPQKPKHINIDAEKDTVDKIIFHLDRSIEIANNCGAIYDKGLLYRQTDQHTKALGVFKTLMRNKGGYCSLMQLSNAFEQAGLCLYDILSEIKEESEERKSVEYDMRSYFKKSIEISCKLVTKIPFLKDCWASAPTLYNFLSGKAKTKETLKDLSFLFRKLENYGEAITVLNELKKITGDENEKAKINLELVENHVIVGNYDDAVLALDMIMCLPNGYNLIDEKLYLTVHIDGGFDALKKGDFEMARLRLKNALDFERCGEDIDETQQEETDTDLEEMSYDVFILCNNESEDKVANLACALRELGLRATFNCQDVAGGALKMSGMCALIEHSKHLLVVCDSEPLSKVVIHNFEMFHDILLKKGHGHTVILTTTPDAMVPRVLSMYARISMEIEIDLDTGIKCYENAIFIKRIRDLIFKLASGKQTV